MFQTVIRSPIGLLKIYANTEAVLRISICDQLDATHKNNANWVTKECEKQLNEYFLGTRKTFGVPFQMYGTEFQKSVWHELLTIKHGATRSYSEIAAAIGKPRAQRAVGTANRLNPLPILVPCHRVIGKDRKLAGYALGIEKKAFLLDHESTGF